MRHILKTWVDDDDTDENRESASRTRDARDAQRGSMDFREHAVWSIRAALKAAYKAGTAAALFRRRVPIYAVENGQPMTPMATLLATYKAVDLYPWCADMCAADAHSEVCLELQDVLFGFADSEGD